MALLSIRRDQDATKARPRRDQGATMRAKDAPMDAKDATMSAKDSTMSAKDSTMSAKDATNGSMSAEDATMGAKDATTHAGSRGFWPRRPRPSRIFESIPPVREFPPSPTRKI